jgi:hypothetical protein
MKLEIKHLAPYLPYKLKCLYTHTNKIGTISNIYTIGDGYDNEDVKLSIDYNNEEHIWMFKPILRPISDLSILVKDEFERYDGIRSGKADEEVINIFCEENGVDEIIENIDLKSLPYECIEYIFRNHYDFFGLIEAGLAIDKTTLK